MGCETQLVSKCLYSRHFRSAGDCDFDPKVSQTDLVFGDG